MVDPSASTTVEPVTEAEEMVTELPAAVTSKRDLFAVVALSASLNVMVSCVPAAFTLADENVGTIPSTSSVPSTAATAECVIVALVAASPVFVIVPPLRASVLRATDAPLSSTSPATMVYSNTSAVPGDPDRYEAFLVAFVKTTGMYGVPPEVLTVTDES